jgi:hypothetical protein
MERAQNTIARRNGSSDCRLTLSAPANRVRVRIHRDDFPNDNATFATLQIVHVAPGGAERVLASMGMAGGTATPPNGKPATTSELLIALGWSYDDQDQPVFSALTGQIIGRVISTRPITRRVEVACDFITRIVPPQHHSVAVVSTGGGTGFTNASGDITWTDTASGSNRAVYVVGGVVRSTGVTTASCSYDSVAMTKIESQACDADGVSTAGIAEVYRLVAPNTTAGATVRLTLNGTGNYGAFGNLNLSGVDQTTPENAGVKKTGTDNVSDTATTPSNGLLLTATLINSSSTDPTASHTEFFDAYGLDSFGDFYYWGASQYTSTAGSVTLQVTNITEEGASSDKWANIIIPVRAASGAINADAPAVALDIIAVAPTVSKSPALPAAAVDFLPVAATATKAATSGQGLLDITAGAPVTSHGAAAGVGAVDFIAVAATAKHDATAGIALVDFIAPAVQEGQTHQLPVAQFDLLPVAPTAVKSAGLPAAGLDLLAVSPTSAKSASLSAVALDVLAVAPTITHAAELPAGAVDFVGVAPATTKAAALPVVTVEFAAASIDATLASQAMIARLFTTLYAITNVWPTVQ